MEERYIWIVLAIPLGCLVLALISVLTLYSRRRSRRRTRGFSLRAVTPLDDAEFESWRRPSQHAQRPAKYGIRSSEPGRASADMTPSMLEKAYPRYADLRTPSPPEEHPASSPASPIQKPERARRKSSVCSTLADRPPTPYSPASTSSEYPRSSQASCKSPFGSPRTHYPSMSEASAFHFDFTKDLDQQERQPICPTSPSERTLQTPYGYGSYHDRI